MGLVSLLGLRIDGARLSGAAFGLLLPLELISSRSDGCAADCLALRLPNFSFFVMYVFMTWDRMVRRAEAEETFPDLGSVCEMKARLAIVVGSK